ncbi:MAG: tyrosine-type recombinase/integrase [Actinomycetota bacterium]|nr:tyrosine-type recombinase/integrase [Actinomycetota bacterium]
MAERIVVSPALEAVVVAFGDYQRRQKRLAGLTVQMQSYGVRAFLAWRSRTGRGDLAGLGPEELSEFVIAEAARISPGAVQAKVTTLRGFVRYLYVSGVVDRDLSAAVPSRASSRFGGLAKGLDAETVRALLDSCDRGRSAGRRDFAVLMLMWRLGLRAVEVSRLRLDDFEWRAGKVRVSGKAGRVDRLPLPADVGTAVVDYMRFGRPVTACREVFIQAVPPPVGMSRNAVVFVSRSASARAGLAVVGGHRLRHTTGSDLLAEGASLREVGQVLRHDDDTTTAIYAKVDPATLGLVVRPWVQGPVR